MSFGSFCVAITIQILIVAYNAYHHQELVNETRPGNPPQLTHQPASDDTTSSASHKVKPNKTNDAEKAVAETTPALSPKEKIRREKIASCLAIYYRQHVNADTLRPWSIMHGLIAYGQRSNIVVKGQIVNAAEHLCANGAGDGLRILYMENGKLMTRQGPGVQGHDGQLLAILAQSGVPADHPLTVEGQTFTLKDLIEYEKLGCHSDSELTFKLIALSHYLAPDETWENDLGEKWDMSRLIREELAQPLTTGACGGTHRLTALSYAVKQRTSRGEKLDGEWFRADAYIQACHAHTWKYQNTDGSFSTSFFTTRANDPELKARLYSTGHILEWLAYSLPEKQLRDVRVTAAVDYLVDLMLEAPGHALDVGPRGHAIHALMMYEQRAFGYTSDYADQALIKAFPISYKKLAPKNESVNQRPDYLPINDSPLGKRQGFLRRR